MSYSQALDLKPWAREVETQPAGNSCVAQVGASMLELMYERAGITVQLSPMYLYYWLRKLDGKTGNVGVNPYYLGKALQDYGICLAKTLPFDNSKLDVPPTKAAIDEAAQYKVEAFRFIFPFPSLDVIKKELCNGKPVAITINVNQSFVDTSPAQRDWKRFDWDANKPTLYTHQVLCIGYDDDAGRLLCENSQGPMWADGGFFGIPYSKAAKILAGGATVLDDIGVPIKKAWYDPERQEAIRAYIKGQLDPVRRAAIEYMVLGDEIDNAMKWPPGTWDIVGKS